MRLGVYFFAILFTAIAVRPQGTVVFNNRNTAVGLDAPVTRFAPNGPGAGLPMLAGLYYAGALVPESVTSFRGDPNGPTPALAKYIIPVTVTLPGTQAGQRNVPVQMAVWNSFWRSYEEAPGWERARSHDLIIAELGGGPNPDVPNYLPVSFTGLVFGFPEPSTVSLLILGGMALLFWRRRE